MEAKTELDRQKELLRLLFRGFQSRKRGQEAQLEVVRVEKRRRAKSEAGRRVELRNWGEKGVEHKPRGLVEEEEEKEKEVLMLESRKKEESLEKIERIKEAQIVLNFVYDQSGKIVYMRFHMVGEHWLSIPLEEWARLALSMEKYVLLYDIFKHSEDRPERYFVKQDFFVLYLYLLLDPRQNFDF